MAHKVFVSYKYADTSVQQLNSFGSYFSTTTVRDYVTKFEERVRNTGIAVYKGESDGEDLSYLSEDTIWSMLKDRIYDSTITIVFISPNMKDAYYLERNQWIPWEVAFSLREQTRSDRTSHTNALLYVILPDRNGGYYYKSLMNQFKIINENEKNGYAEVVQWNSFISNIPYYIEQANYKKARTPSYLVCKQV